MSITSSTSVATVLAISAAALASVVPAASAKGGPGIRVAGLCTQSSSAKLKLGREDGGRAEIEFEVDQNRSGVPWRVTLRRNGALVTSTVATTHAPSGSFTVRLITRTQAGDHVTASATRSSGERCTARAAV
jgi:hypothetical protein